MNVVIWQKKTYLLYLVLFDHCTTKLKMMMEEGIPALIASAKQWRLFKRSFDIFSCRSSHHVKNRFHFPIFTLHKCSHLHFCFKHIHTTTTYLVHSMKYWEWAAHMFLYCCFLLASNNSQLKEICNMISDRSMQKNDRRVKDFFFGNRLLLCTTNS